MPWCPKCRNEYREGFTVCADCGVELVDRLDEAKADTVKIISGPTEEMNRVYEFLQDNKIKGVYLEESEEGITLIQGEKKYLKEITFAIKTYFDKRREEMDEYVQKQQEQLHAKFGSDEDDEDDETDSDDSEGISLDDDDDEEDDDDDEEDSRRKTKKESN